MISPVLWVAETCNERIAEEPTLLNRALFRLAGAAYRLDYWLGLPWRCKIRHTAPVQRDYYNADAGCIEESVLHCGRCDHFFGYSERDPLRSHALELRRWHFLRYWSWHLTHHPVKAAPVFVRWAWRTRFGRTVRSHARLTRGTK